MYPARLPDVHSSQDAMLKLHAMEFPTAYEQLQKVGDVYTYTGRTFGVTRNIKDSSRNMQVTKSDTMPTGSQSGDCR